MGSGVCVGGAWAGRVEVKVATSAEPIVRVAVKLVSGVSVAVCVDVADPMENGSRSFLYKNTYTAMVITRSRHNPRIP